MQHNNRVEIPIGSTYVYQGAHLETIQFWGYFQYRRHPPSSTLTQAVSLIRTLQNVTALQKAAAVAATFPVPEAGLVIEQTPDQTPEVEQTPAVPAPEAVQTPAPEAALVIEQTPDQTPDVEQTPAVPAPEAVQTPAPEAVQTPAPEAAPPDPVEVERKKMIGRRVRTEIDTMMETLDTFKRRRLDVEVEIAVIENQLDCLQGMEKQFV